jgi:hypothetical protein
MVRNGMDVNNALDHLARRRDFHDNLNNFDSNELATEEIFRLVHLQELATRPDFVETGANIANFQTIEQIRGELRRLDNQPRFISQRSILLSNPDFIATRQNIANFTTLESVVSELYRLRMIARLRADPSFIATGQDIANFQTSDLADDEFYRLHHSTF